MLTRLKTLNFRGFKEIDVPLSRLNIFLGPNNSGKSNILSALNLLSQTLNSEYSEIPLLLNGDRVTLGTYKDIVLNNEVKKNIIFEIAYDNKKFNNIRNLDSNTAIIYLSFSYKELDRKIILEKIIIKNEIGSILLELRYNYPSDNFIIEKCFELSVETTEFCEIDDDLKLERLENFLPFPISIEGAIHNFDMNLYCEGNDLDYVYAVPDLIDRIRSNLKKIDFIGPLREFPERTYFFTGVSPHNTGSKGQNLPQILSMKKEILENINYWGKKAGLFNEIVIENPTDRHFELKIKNFSSDEVQNWADVGFGISQFLPILIACINCASLNEESGLIIEQPELHLHPRAQAEMGSLFCNLIAESQNSQYFIETHSEHLVVRTQYEIAKGTISSDDVKIFYVYTENSEKIIKQIQINPDGTFADEWPEGFFPEGYEEAKKFSKAVRERKSKNG